MSHSVELSGVTLDYPVYSVRAKSLRSAMFARKIGGQMYNNQDVTIVRALSNISFKLQEGDRLALVGHNGSGKTTLLKVLAGVYEPTAGQIRVDGSVATTISIGAGLDYDATGLQNVYHMGRMRMVSRKAIQAKLDDIVECSGLAQFIHLPVRTYSLGMVARLMFAVTTAFEADVVIMDEWLSAGDADFQEQARARMTEFIDRAKIVVVATHDFHMARDVCNKVCALGGGKVGFFGTTAEWVQWIADGAQPLSA
ncbi:ABC transporter ATP-binding protein [Caulobacter sp. BK020]|uniref:ABC transporter ATP-binding protein n=1 Tax=Caulobacter sp. BK020 TaxID=2512117 RepID=UPI00104E6624|nr:ABC transporter ATP-binding protein [Caulobacter sp. BK020]TCS10424.1 lipopolysaccharide transport system ATP-binding protein [Caulobacter sp. BK020]